jgi:hypothetical protein
MCSVNLQFLLNILDILDIKVWSLKKEEVCVTLFLAVLHFLGAKNARHVHFFQDETKKCALNISIFYKKILCVGANDYVRYIPFYFCKFLSITFS